MRILVVGGGGREHAIVWKLAQSRRKAELFCAPGNAGIAKLAECVPIKATDIKGMIEFAKNNSIDLVFVAPDDPLAAGLVDRLKENGIAAFGPTAKAAEIESSKVFSKALMNKYGIPTAEHKVFDDIGKAVNYINTLDPPIVVKADGLALGKGVIIASSREDAEDAVRNMISGQAFGIAGKRVIIEEFLEGKELTVLAFTDGYTIKAMPNSRDHKKAMDDDKGLNTGGMGAICPGEYLTESDWEELYNEIFLPTIKAMRKEGRPFEGVIYFGLMLTSKGPKVIEYNARFGDPETQAVLPLLETDFIDIIEAVMAHRLDKIDIKWSDRATCCVVMASGGYPSSYETGYEISGLDGVEALVFHAGTKAGKNNQILTSGGRVLSVTAYGNSVGEAVGAAYNDISKIRFKDMHYRKDIGRSK